MVNYCRHSTQENKIFFSVDILFNLINQLTSVFLKLIISKYFEDNCFHNAFSHGDKVNFNGLVRYRLFDSCPYYGLVDYKMCVSKCISVQRDGMQHSILKF